ncbi:hypothetical protein VNO77_39155 [Canavalia gladiata]|uniref:Uncharacterized protein n=1 Tax=Canavalia gladiata TaxID=3824 RepID=A0AAN9KCW5_CANGL
MSNDSCVYVSGDVFVIWDREDRELAKRALGKRMNKGHMVENVFVLFVENLLRENAILDAVEKKNENLRAQNSGVGLILFVSVRWERVNGERSMLAGIALADGKNSVADRCIKLFHTTTVRMFNSTLLQFKREKSMHSLFLRQTSIGILLLVYVDDMFPRTLLAYILTQAYIC